uniref:EGF-like domain-containing protein n=1 Tax=Zea mays TaxID=4577 RepID=A0A804PQP1_MAIZE
MASNTLRFLQAIAPIVLLARLAQASAQPQRQPSQLLPPGVARPGCRDRCGNITIPYPFGIGAGCYREEYGFELLCDDARSPPRLTISGGYQLASLSLSAGEVRIYLNATRKCYNVTTGAFVDRNDDASLALGSASPYRVSPTKTRLVATGCPTIGYFVDGAGYFVSGCTSVCRPAQYAVEGQGPCTGVGCCQSAIPSDIYYYEPNTLSLQLQAGKLDPILGANVTTCQYVFLADADWFSYTDSVFFNRTDDFAAPVVFDWAVRNVGNCSAAKLNMTDYACRSRDSECVPSSNGAGYRCNCSQGYEGNPYLDGGCRDIDECLRPDEYQCYGNCTNLPGHYICKCRPGTDGDPRQRNGCRPKDKFTPALKVVTEEEAHQNEAEVLRAERGRHPAAADALLHQRRRRPRRVQDILRGGAGEGDQQLRRRPCPRPRRARRRLQGRPRGQDGGGHQEVQDDGGGRDQGVREGDAHPLPDQPQERRQAARLLPRGTGAHAGLRVRLQRHPLPLHPR